MTELILYKFDRVLLMSARSNKTQLLLLLQVIELRIYILLLNKRIRKMLVTILGAWLHLCDATCVLLNLLLIDAHLAVIMILSIALVRILLCQTKILTIVC